MIADDLVNYSIRVREAVHVIRDAEHMFHEEAFTKYALDALEDAGEIEMPATAGVRGRGFAVSGWALDEDERRFRLFIDDTRNSAEIESLTATETKTFFNRLAKLAEKAFMGFANDVEATHPARHLLEELERRKPNLDEIHLYLVSNARARDPRAPVIAPIEGIDVICHIWDLERLHRLESSGGHREPIMVDLYEHGGPVNCVASPSTNPLGVYLLVLPARVLGDVYDKYGNRLLERNVRSFLQLKGGVNRGIRATLGDEPSYFLAYNNGISATASSVDLVRQPDGQLAVARLHDLQIVNGGQTTASIHSAMRRDKLSLDDVFVQMKLTVVPEEQLDAVVSRISEYANTQNKVTAADLSSNHPFHIECERISRTLWAPAIEGSQRQTHWFYERARGQYSDEQSRQVTASAKAAFKTSNPTNQKVTKTEVAKYYNSWAQLPHLVSLGAEKNFQKFMVGVASDERADEDWFREMIAKAILFKATEKIVTEQRLGAYRANVVAYTIARLSAATDRQLDFERIWKDQRITAATSDALTQLVKPVYDIITNPTGSVRNVGEWSKKPECWRAVREFAWEPSRELFAEIPGRGSPPARLQVAIDDFDGVPELADTNADLWFRMSRWAKENDRLNPWYRRFAYSIGTRLETSAELSSKQTAKAMETLAMAVDAGFDLDVGE